MASDAFADICGEPLWSAWPNVSECCVDTILVWVPVGFLWLSLPYYVSSVRKLSSRAAYRVTLLNGGRLGCCLALAVLCLVQLLVRAVHSDGKLSTATVLAACLHAASYLLLAAMTQYERLKGVQSSAVPFVFWFITSLCGFVTLYAFIVQRKHTTEKDRFVLFAVSFTIQIVCLILTGFTDHDGISAQYTGMGQMECPETTCSFPSYLAVWWMRGLFMASHKRDVEEKDLWKLPPALQSSSLLPLYEDAMHQERQRCNVLNSTEQRGTTASEPKCAATNYPRRPAGEKTHLCQDSSARFKYDAEQTRRNTITPSLIRVLVRLFLGDFIVCVVLKLSSDLLLLLVALLLGILMDVAKGDEDQKMTGWVLCVAMLLILVVRAALFVQSLMAIMRTGVKVKSTLIGAIYKKALTMKNRAKSSATSGEIINLMSVDAQRIQNMMIIFVYFVVVPLNACACFVALYYTIGGPSALVGVALLVLMMLLNSYLVTKQRTLLSSNLTFKDARIRLFNEILNGIKVLKLYAWEPSFREKIRALRLKEVAILFKLAVLNTLIGVLWDMSAYLVTLVTFAAYITMEGNGGLDSTKAFVTLSILRIMMGGLDFFSTRAVALIQAYVSIKRMNKFLVGEDIEPEVISPPHSGTPDSVFMIENGSFTWESAMTPTLKSINLSVGEGRLLAVVGPVGCGKSSLINAILGEMDKVKGTVISKGYSTAYVPQQAWIRNATVRDNILFGKPYIQSRFQQVVRMCELERDMAMLPAGDLTEIGEKGINLSGGQKQRVSVARAVYSDSDLYLLDDPLSAVDSHVGQAIFDNVIGPNGLLKGKTRVLVTHGLQWLPMVDDVIVMQDGRISERGSFAQLMSHDGPFARYLKTYHCTVEENNKHDHDCKAEETALSRQCSIEGDDALRRTNGKQTTVETIQKGKVSREIIVDLAKAAGILPMSVALLSYCAFQASNVGAGVWLKLWTGDPGDPTRDMDTRREDSYSYLEIYGVFGALLLLFSVGFNFVFWARMTTAARVLHSRLADRLMRAPMTFFDTTPIGRILNRVSLDVEVVDNTLPTILRELTIALCSSAASLLVVLVQTPLSGAVLLPVVLIFYFCQSFCVRTIRQLQRLDSASRSPIYELLSETLSGAQSIRAYGATDRFLQESKRRVDGNQACNFAAQAALRSLQFILEILAAVVVFTSALFAVLKSSSQPGDLGLSVSFALPIISTFVWLMRQMCEFETNIISVERMKEYSELETEAEWIQADKRPPAAWPKKGDITFDSYQTRYREGLDLVLKGVNFNIQHGEKVGVVGRTGAGKSTLALSLFRLLESAGGAIYIDGANIAGMGLHDLRSRLTILPQDPVLFSGSLRMNLDPFEEYSDDQLWTALDRAHLKAAVMQLRGGLSFQCGEEGAGLSVGQRQLLCLARTLLRRTKILVLDEATAAVDMETDALIQATIRESFSDCTVLAVAHRLKTVLDCDRILVLEAGHVKEFASPNQLLSDKTSLFYSMAKTAGLV